MKYLLPGGSFGDFIEFETSPGGFELDSFFWEGTFNQADLGLPCTNADCIEYEFGKGVLTGGNKVILLRGLNHYPTYRDESILAEYTFEFQNGAEFPVEMSELDQLILTNDSGNSFKLYGVFDSCENVSCGSRQRRCRVEVPGDIFGLGQSQGRCIVLPYNPF